MRVHLPQDRMARNKLVGHFPVSGHFPVNIVWKDAETNSRLAIVDGGYAKRPFLRPAEQAGFTVVGRLRKDAALRSLPATTRRPGQRGPLPAYDKQRPDLNSSNHKGKRSSSV